MVIGSEFKDKMQCNDFLVDAAELLEYSNLRVSIVDTV